MMQVVMTLAAVAVEVAVVAVVVVAAAVVAVVVVAVDQVIPAMRWFRQGEEEECRRRE